MSQTREPRQEDPRIVAIRRRFPAGLRARLTASVERYPHFIAPEGATGTISHETEGGLELTLDAHLPGAEEWDNQIVWTVEDLLDWPLDEVVPRDALRVPEMAVIPSPSFSVSFEESMPDGEPVAFVTGTLAEDGAYAVERVDEASEWRRSGSEGERAPDWMQVALDALSAAWWQRLEAMREAESAAGWDPTP